MKNNVLKFTGEYHTARVDPETKFRVIEKVHAEIAELNWMMIAEDSPDPQFVMVGDPLVLQEIMRRVREPRET